MKQPGDQWCVQIDVTSACVHRCSNCTHLVGRYRHPWHMSPAQYEAAVLAVRDHPGAVGMIGGEPQIHPDFAELCEILQRHIPRERRALFTAIRPRPIAKRTFGQLHLNAFKGSCWHQPVLVASSLVVSNWRDYASRCWLRDRWSCSVTPKGFYFCEVAGAMAMLINGPAGIPPAPGCWNRPPATYEEQAAFWCSRCGVCLPLKARRASDEIDDVCPAWAQWLETTRRTNTIRTPALESAARAFRYLSAWHRFRIWLYRILHK